MLANNGELYFVFAACFHELLRRAHVHVDRLFANDMLALACRLHSELCVQTAGHANRNGIYSFQKRRQSVEGGNAVFISEFRGSFGDDVVNACKLRALGIRDRVDMGRPDHATTDNSELYAQQSPPAFFTTFRNAFTATSKSSGPDVPP